MGRMVLLPSRSTERTEGDARPADPRLALVALLLAVAGAAAMLIPAGPARLMLLLAFTTAGPGAAIVSHLRIGDRVLAAALTVTFSASLSSLVATVMVWTGRWHPTSATAGLIALVAVVALVGLRRADGIEVRLPVSVPAAPASGRGHPALTPALLTVAVTLWLVTVLRADAGQIGPYGLTRGLGVPFVFALLLVGVACGVELFGRARVLVLLAGVGALALIMWGTAPLLLPVPEYAWTYKHLGVVEFIQQRGTVLDSDDIYQQWPGFFAAAAQLSTVAGVPAIRFASWSTLYFGLLDAVLVAAVVRGLTRNPRTAFLAVLLFECCLWVDQNYFSPQAFAYALSLGFFALVMHGCRGLPALRAAGRVNRMRAWLVRDAPAVRDRPRWPLLVVVVVVFAAITAAHQLTPYLLLFGVGVLTVLGLIRPHWLFVLLAVVAGGYLLPRLGGVSSQYHLFDGFDLFKNASGNAEGWGSSAQRFSALVARVLALVVWASALAVGVLFRRRLGRVLIPLVLGFTPFLVLLLQNYGGEAIYRVFLFSLPWCVMLMASWWARTSRGLVSGLAFTVLALAGLQGLQGQFALHVVPPADVRAARYLEANAPAGSTMALVAPAFPARLTANYDQLNPGRSVDPSITDEPTFHHLVLDAGELPAIEEWAASFGGTETFLVVTGQMAKTAEYFGYLPSGSVAALRSALDDSARWSTYYRRADVTIYRLEPPD
ncbi:hypothetical protein [Cryptosporangium sp. NPDC051539]|uniref:hypothetical protein n=1 Tax=Cryptosporangium sp. NPDC051539 TaxID=3363962 RepID=UPI0037A3757C